MFRTLAVFAFASAALNATNNILDVATAQGCAQFVTSVGSIPDLADTAKSSDAPAPFWAFVFKDPATPLPTGKELKHLIENHVIPGKDNTTTALTAGQSLETVKGKHLTVVDATHIKGDKVTAAITATVACDNGVVFVIDQLLDIPAN